MTTADKYHYAILTSLNGLRFKKYVNMRPKFALWVKDGDWSGLEKNLGLFRKFLKGFLYEEHESTTQKQMVDLNSVSC